MRGDGMRMPGDEDELISRIAALEPARGTPPLSKRSIRTLVRAASVTPREVQAWTWPRYRLASLGALVGSGALVVAAILGLDSVGTPLPAAFSAALHTTSHPRVPPTAPTAGVEYSAVAATVTVNSAEWAAACPVTLDVRRAETSHSLARGPGHATAYRIASALSPPRALLVLAPHFGLARSRVKWYSMGAHARGWWVGSLAGPSLTTYSRAGITWWSYAGPSESRQRLVREAGALGRNLESGAVSTNDAEHLVAGLVKGVQFASPSAGRSSTSVEVALPLAVHGVVTDEHFDVDYYAGGRLAAAAGPLTSVIGAVTYPTITPLGAAQLLRRPKGALVALAPLTSTTATGSHGTSGAPVPTLYCDTPKGLASVSSASMTLSTNALSNGLVWLLPSWTFSAMLPDRLPQASSVAINPRYLHYQRATIRYRRPQHTR